MNGNYHDAGVDGWLTDATNWVGDKISDGADWVGDKAKSAASATYREGKKYAKKYGKQALVAGGAVALAPFTGGSSLAVAGNALVGMAAGAAAAEATEYGAGVAERTAKRAFTDKKQPQQAPILITEPKPFDRSALVSKLTLGPSVRSLNSGAVPALNQRRLLSRNIVNVPAPAVEQAASALTTVPSVPKKSNTALYIGLGVVGVAAVAYFVSKKK